MKTICDHSVFTLSKDHAIATTVKSGERVVFDTKDCFNNQIFSEDQSMDSLDWSTINPATGPIYIEEAMPGDTLKITIEDIEVAAVGTMAAIPDNGVLGSVITESQIKRIPVKEGIAYFSNTIQIPCEPMIGVIGVAPEDEAIPCGEPGSHGGNMDNNKIKKGATLYLPIFHEGALLAMGDDHACMGDGEIMVTGLEIPAKITVQVELIKGQSISNPMLEDDKSCYTIASDIDLEKAIFEATKEMVQVLMRKLGLSFNEAGMLLSAMGNVQICQVVDPKRTVRMEMKKTVLAGLF